MGMFDPPKPVDTTPRENPKAGVHPARFVWMLDLGTVLEPGFEDASQLKPKHQILLGFELSGAKMSDGRPFMVSGRFTVTNGKWGPYCSRASKLRDILKSWQGWDEKKSANLQNLASLLGSECFLQVILKESKRNPGNFYAELGTIMPLPEGMKADPQTNPIKTFECKKDADLEEVPPFLHDRIKNSFEYKGEVFLKGPVTTDEDISF